MPQFAVLQDSGAAMAETAQHGGKGRPVLAGSPGAKALPPLVEAKLAIPIVRPGTVDRPRIRQALDAGEDAALTLVAAPAGYGKTTAVRSWCASVDAGLAWVTLDAGDSDPVRLWRYLATAVDRVRPGLGRGALQRLDVAGGPIEDAVDELMNGIAAFESELVVVLDDLHAVTNEECLASIDHALEHLPPNARLVVVTRVDPALRLAQLRARGALTEARATELAFTRAEAHELLVVQGRVELGREELDGLVERTEGWPAALVLAGLWLRTVDDPVSAVRSFGGDHRFVADYLSGEVLASLDESSRSFLYGAAVLGELTPELGDAVFDRTDSAAQLAELERSNFFVLRLGRGGWFRIHSLLAEYAKAQLASLDPATTQGIQRQAAAWLRSRGMPLEAIGHAAASHDHGLVADILVEYHVPLISFGQSRSLLHWVGTLPDDCVVEHPELTVAAAIAAILDAAGLAEQRRYLQLAERVRAGQPERSSAYAETWALVARALIIEGGVGQAVLDARQAVGMAEGEPEIIGGALAAYARALFFAGELEEAFGAALRVLRHPGMDRRVPALVIAQTTRVFVDVECGRLASARSHAERAKAAVGRIGSGRSRLGANALAALGAVLAAEGKLAEAERELGTAEHLFRDEVATLHHAWLLVLLARVRVQRGRLDDAQVTLGSAQEALAELGDSGRVPALADTVALELEEARARARGGEVLESPSEAELAVLRLLETDMSLREIGERLFISPNTVRSHTHALYRKLGVHSRTDALARATALGLLEQTESPG